MKIVVNIALLLLSLWIGGCSKDSLGVETPEVQNHVTILFSLSGVGDNGYNDLALTGVLTAQRDNDIELHLLYPTSQEEAGEFISDWVDYGSSEGKKSLLILASSDYETLVEEYIPDDVLESRDVLLFESKNQELNVSKFMISMYGTSYLAGAITPVFGENAAVITANDFDSTINDAAQGFYDGFIYGGGGGYVRESLSDSWDGYAMSSEAYILTAELSKQASFIFPLAGGSNLGVFRYTRDYPDGIYTSGVDVDQAGYSTQVAFSVMKHLDLLLEDYIDMWLNDITLPRDKVYGMESGYIELSLSPNYQELCSDRYNTYINQAILKEQEYEGDDI
ncbi:MAG: BMP family ABC transporter substrate-binding protein [Rikenellaceae bacterium]